MPPEPARTPGVEAIAEQVFAALADPSRRAMLAALAANGPATATDLAAPPADHPPGHRQAPRAADEAGLVTAEPGERRRVRYRLRSAPMRVAQQFLAALARDWDGPLDALKEHLDRCPTRDGRKLETHHARHPDRHRAGVGHRTPGSCW